MHARQNRQVLYAATVAAAASLVLVAIVSVALPNLQAKPAELDSTAGLPAGWHKDTDGNGKTYYWNRKLGTSSWDPPTATKKLQAPKAAPKLHFLEQAAAAQPLPLTVAPEGAAGWDQMAVPLDQLGRTRSWDGSSRSSNGARKSPQQLQPRTLQALAPVAGAAEGDEDDEKTYGEISPTAGWPRDLAGASGDDTSWVVGMHREPLWTDSMTHACGLTEPCPTGRADHGHGMQMDTNPYVDKRRTFDPYAYGDPYADAATRGLTAGRNNYPWDPTQDAQFYGSNGADCSDGALKHECYEKPELDDLRNRQDVWRKKYDEFAAPTVGEEEEEEEEKEEAEEKSEEEEAAEATAEQEEQEAAAKKDGMKGALLHMPEITDPSPWARSIKTGMLSAGNSIKTGMLHASAAVKATAEQAAADAEQKKDQAHFVGGEPVLSSLGKVVDKFKSAYTTGKGFFSESNLSELERKFLRAHGARHQQQLARHQALRAFDGALLKPSKSTTTLLAAIHSSAPAVSAGKSQGTAKSTGTDTKDATIWESPDKVAAHGLYGSAQAVAAQKQKDTDTKRAAVAKVLASVSQGKTQEGPLPQVRAEAIKVAEEAEAGAENLIKKVTGKTRDEKPWEEANMQKGVLRKESTESNLMALVKEHDDKLLQEASGLSASELKKAMDDAARDSKGNKKAITSKALKPWQQKVAQQGTLKHETVEQNLKAALKAREKMLWKEKTGWKSIKDMREAEAFADNLEREIKNRHKEEVSHPLIPTGAKSLLNDETGSSIATKAAKGKSEEVRARAKEARERRELDRLREGEPLVKALQAEVDNDEQELTDEAEQQRMTLKQLHRDQTKLSVQLDKEESLTPRKAAARGYGTGHHTKHKSENANSGGKMKTSHGQQLAYSQGMSANKVKTETPTKNGLSSTRANDDLAEYFAKQEVGGDLKHPVHSKKTSHN